jgi:hypothetical protein
MRTVEILRRTPDAETEALARFTVATPGRPAEMEVLIPEFREGLELLGIGLSLADGDGHRIDPGDGEAYLDALLIRYRGSRLWARELQAGGD